jgi:hypothetical protein
LHQIVQLRNDIRANLGSALDAIVADRSYSGTPGDAWVNAQSIFNCGGGGTQTTYARLSFANDAPTRDRICRIIGSSGGVDSASTQSNSIASWCMSSGGDVRWNNRGTRHLSYNGSSWVLGGETQSGSNLSTIDCN